MVIGRSSLVLRSDLISVLVFMPEKERSRAERANTGDRRPNTAIQKNAGNRTACANISPTNTLSSLTAPVRG
jgi:hypothetical protein